MLLQVVKRPLRPLLPVLPSLHATPVPSVIGSHLMPEAAQSLTPQELVNGFLPHQIGQLYCLLHDHVQLLVQVYSLSVLDPSRQHIASQIQGFLSEMVQKRDEILAQRSVPHPSFCFQFHYCHSLQTDGLQLETSGSSKKHGDSGGLSSLDCSRQVSGIRSDEICAQSTPGSPDSSRDIEGFSWLPFVGGPVFSVLDVAPLKLVGKYMEDVSKAVHEHRRRFLEATTSMDLEKEPLFPLPVHTSFLDASGEAGTAVRTSAESTLQASSPSPQRPSKKTLAATLVENTKKECVALVPKPIARLALQFYPLLNPTLFPHKPPPSPVANRLLFTDAEDELLAMGMMEYNTDWKLIQQRFLPCKTKHQIFVRQKNRCTSKAPDNPIKAVRRMKTAPLTEEEKVHIHEALKVFKRDWISVWKFVVPYRDPSLLPRQWRIATGTQKSYRMDSAKREKRRLYDLKRRKRNTAIGSSPDSDKEIENAGRKKSAKHPIHKESEAYVHEGFLRDWRPPYARSVSFPISASVNHSRAQSSPYSGQTVVVRNELNNDNQGQTSRGHRNELATSLNNTTAHFAGTSNSVSNGQAPRLTLNQPYYRPYRARRHKSSQTVKLAPDLPPIHLPPSVRVISQTAFRSSHDGRNVESSGASHGEKVTSHVTPKQNVIKVLNPKQMMVPSQEGASSKQGCNPEGCTGSDFQMHPLMFDTTEGGNLPYYPLNYNGRTLSAFTFFPVNAPLTSVQNPGSKSRKLTCSRKSTRASSGVDFHPLLKSCETGNNNSFGACQTAPSPASLELSRNTFSDSRSVYNGGTSARDKARDAIPVVANGLNLEINLNSAPTYEKDLCRENWGQGNLMASPVTAVRSDDGAKSTQGIQANDGAGFDCDDTMCSQSPPEIVMEQEELSDSDEEIEDVEFEREEMTDSEGEEDDGEERGGGEVCEIEQLANAHNQGNQEVSSIRDGSRLGPDSWKDKVPACSHSPVSEDNGPSSPWLSLSSLASRSTLPSRTAKRASGSHPR
ncbi:Myb-like protein [Drosera capensis]